MQFDIVISSCKKDEFVLQKAIESIKQYIKGYRRIIVVSNEKLTDAEGVEWFDEKKYPSNNVPRPPHWSGWRLMPSQIEFWLDGEGRIHERLNYKKENGSWKKELLYP